MKRLRATYRLSQNGLAALLGISVKTLRNWDVVRPSAPQRRGKAKRRSTVA